jgi:hypothetical protein
MSTSQFSGCRAHPTPKAVGAAVAVAREAADQLVGYDFSSSQAADFITVFNRAILYLLWHQAFAIAARAICSPYIPTRSVSSNSGLTVIRDKDSDSGHKARLVWLPPVAREHMAQTETLLQAFRAKRSESVDRIDDEVFFLGEDMSERQVTPTLMENVASFFPFPCNTPRRVMRCTLVGNAFPREMVDTFMGHWRERQEPWGKWSTFSYEQYLQRLETTIPDILSVLGFRLPRKAGSNAKRRVR